MSRFATDTPLSVSFDDVLAAADRLRGLAHRTPVLTSRTLDGIVGASVFLKAECYQRVGAFKFRGAANAIARLTTAQRRAGVLTYSSGNHAQAIALAGALADVRTTIVMPTDAPEVKRRATEGYGAEVVLYDRASTTREALGARLAEERGLTIIPPYDHPDVIAGQGTATLELLEDSGPLDALFVCCGGGGLLSGAAVTAKAWHERRGRACRVIGVEPSAADDATRSFRTGTLQKVENPDTIADGARTPYLGDHTFPIVLRLVDDMRTVSEGEIARWTLFAMERLKAVVEPSGALGLAGLAQAAEAEPEEVRGARVGVIISGGNLDLDLIPALRALAGCA